MKKEGVTIEGEEETERKDEKRGERGEDIYLPPPQSTDRIAAQLSGFSRCAAWGPCIGR